MGLREIAGGWLVKMGASVSGFNAATTGRRTLNIGQTSRGINNLALAEGDKLLRMARKAALDNHYAVVAIEAFISEVIGTGIRPHSRHPNPEIRRTLEREFALWAPQSSTSRRIGIDGKPDSLQSFFGQQNLICRNLIEAGESFARLRPRLAADLSPSGLRVPLQIDLIEPEQLPFWRMTGATDPRPADVPAGNLIRAGIEFDQIHQRVAYHFYREHPGDSSVWPNAFETVRVPAGSVLHCIEFVRGNQIRGITKLAPILMPLSDLEEFDDGERYREKLGSYLFAWKKTTTPDDPQLAGTDTTAGTDTAPAGAAYVEAQPGGITVLDTNAGEDMGFYNHPGVAATYGTFMKIQREQIAAAMRVSYEMQTGDMTQVNYSSARVRLITLRRIWEQFQQAVVVHQFCRPVWRAWLDAAALAGVINASDYSKNPEQYLDVEWLAQPWEWIDPKTDVNSVRMKIESCLTSRSREVAKLGRDAEQVDAEIKQDHDREAELGIVPVYGASRVTETVPPGDNEELAGTEPKKPTPIGGKAA